MSDYMDYTDQFDLEGGGSNLDASNIFDQFDIGGGSNLDLSNIFDQFDIGGVGGGLDLNNVLQGQDLTSFLDNLNTDLSGKSDFSSSMGMDETLLQDLGLGSLADITSGTNLDSMKGYQYDPKTGTWITPEGQTYTPAIVPSGKAKSGAQVMVDAGALPDGYAGLHPSANSTAGGNADKYQFNVGADGKSLLDKTSVINKAGVDKIIDNTKAGGANPAATKSGMDPMMMMLLMYLMSQMGKSGSSTSQAVIPQLQANQKMLPYTAPSRPGAGGQTYFSPTTYTPKASGGMIGYAGGGGISTLGGYSDGGRLLRGPGDGVSDNIPATIAGKQPARLADGEFVVPARIVSELGNGSTEAGAKRLYEMMDRVQKARRKTKNVAADTKAAKYLPA